MTNNLEVITDNYIDTRIIKRVAINGVEFDESFVADLISNHFKSSGTLVRPTFASAFEIYIKEHPSAHKRKFIDDANLYFGYFLNQFGNLKLDELKHHHITKYRDHQLARGLKPSSVRKHINTLNAILNSAFKHLDINRLSPFRSLSIRGENDCGRPIPLITAKMLEQVKDRLTVMDAPYKMIALIQLNTGMRISEPSLARLDDCVLEHDIPHIWVRKNSLTDRKTLSSIRAIPLCGVSLTAAQKLYEIAKQKGSDWLAPNYAHEKGNASCSAIINKHLRDLEFRSHMFRHALIDRLKACNDVPTRLAESITGHSSGGSDFNTYGTVGYTLEQKRDVLMRVLV